MEVARSILPDDAKDVDVGNGKEVGGIPNNTKGHMLKRIRESSSLS
jgi:hypothetical protein